MQSPNPENGRARRSHLMNGNSFIDARPPFHADEISLRDFAESLRKGKWLIVGTTIVIVALAAIYTYTRDPLFSAASTVYVNNQQSTPQLSDMLGMQVDNRNIANEVEILKSRTIATRVAQRLMQYGSVPGTGEMLSVLAADEATSVSELTVAGRLQGLVDVRPVSPTVDMIEIRAKSTVPQEAALIADTYAEEFVEYNRSLSRSRMTASREFLSGVTERFEDDLEIAEEDLTAFLDQEQVVAPEEEARQLIQQATELQQLQYQTQHELGMAQAELSAIEQEVEQMVPGLAEKISSGDNILIDGLIQQISRLKLVVEQKYARNPALRSDPSLDQELLSTLGEIESLEQDLNDRADRLVETAVRTGALTLSGSGPSSGAESRLSTLQQLRGRMMEKQVQMSGFEARLNVVDGQLNTVKDELGRIPGQEIVLNRLERSLRTREQLYLTLVEKLQEARIAEQSQLGYVDIIDTALIPLNPVSPIPQRNMIFATILGVLLGLGLSFTVSALDNKVRKPEDLRNHGIPVLSTIPDMKSDIKREFGDSSFQLLDGREYSTSLVALLSPLAPSAEGFRRLATNLQFSQPDHEIKSLLVTSPTEGDGKTSIALNLAIVSAQMGNRTICIDTDFRRPAVHTRMGVNRMPGLSDLMFDNSNLELGRFASPVDNLFVIPTGRKVPNPSRMLESKSFRDFIRQLEQAFDMVIIDGPPVLVVADVLSIAGRSDATILACSVGETTWRLLDHSLEELSNVRSKFAGVVLNRFDASKAYGDYRRSYYYYAPEDEANDWKSRSWLNLG